MNFKPNAFDHQDYLNLIDVPLRCIPANLIKDDMLLLSRCMTSFHLRERADFSRAEFEQSMKRVRKAASLAPGAQLHRLLGWIGAVARLKFERAEEIAARSESEQTKARLLAETGTDRARIIRVSAGGDTGRRIETRKHETLADALKRAIDREPSLFRAAHVTFVEF